MVKFVSLFIMNHAVVLIGGEAGQGIFYAGDIFCKAILEGGLEFFSRVEFPSLIRGGHNSINIRVSDKEVRSSLKNYDLIVALDENTVNQHKSLLKSSGRIICNEGIKVEGVEVYHVPFEKILKKFEATSILKNAIALGATCAVLSYDFKFLEQAIRKDLDSKKVDKKLIVKNIEVSKFAYDYIQKNYGDDFEIKLEGGRSKNKRMINGNRSLVEGALKAECKFMGAYPMSPATSIMEEFDKTEGVVMKQAFDEIGAIGFALGASFAGVRSMTATSGGGLDLMGEFVSLVGSSEQPLVIVDVQRPGAATGLPTRQGQSDLNLVLNVGHGEFPRVVLVPGDVEELYYETFNAFNIADKYQLPVLVLSDKHLASSVASLSVFDSKNLVVDRGEIVVGDVVGYKRFSITESGVSPRSIPGKGPVFNSSSDEHNEEGLIFEGADNKVVMEDKRFRKLEALKKELVSPKLYGEENVDITLVSFGSTKAAVLEALGDLKNENVNVNFLQLICVCPFPSEYVQSVLSKSKKIICVEENKTGQLASLIRRETGIEIKEKLLKYDGRAFFPCEIFDRVLEVYNG